MRFSTINLIQSKYESKVHKVEIKIENENLANYVMFKLDKLENGFTEEELAQITEVVIDYNSEQESSFVFLEELKKLKNLRSLTLRNGYIYNDNYNIFLYLNNLSELVFDNCEFENADLITMLRLKSLSLINCKIANYNFIDIFKTLEKLAIVNGTVELERINMLRDLNYLQLSYSNITDKTDLRVYSLRELHIDNTNIADLNFLNNLPNLGRIGIDEEQYSNNKDLFDSLMKKDILVLNENMVGFGGAKNEI